MSSSAMPIEFRKIETNGIALNVAVAGPETGRVVVFLHGFPEYGYAWEKQIVAFAALGYRVLAPDQRGYNESDRPGNYRLTDLVADVVGLIRASSPARPAFVVAHDWGGVVAWSLAETYPELIEKLVVLNAPHPAVMGKHLKGDLTQLKMSWYIFFFQIPFLPEFALARSGRRMLRKALTGSSRRGTFSEEELARYDAAWAKPGAIRAMLGWYRQNFLTIRRPTRKRMIAVPTLVLWGKRDRALRWEMAEESARRVERCEVEIYDDCTHWLPHEEPVRVRERILRFFSA